MGDLSNCCDFCKQAASEIRDFKNGYGKTGQDKYTPQALNALHDLRNELCKHKANCTHADCCAQELINKIDSDPDIQGKI